MKGRDFVAAPPVLLATKLCGVETVQEAADRLAKECLGMPELSLTPSNETVEMTTSARYRDVPTCYLKHTFTGNVPSNSAFTCAAGVGYATFEGREAPPIPLLISNGGRTHSGVSRRRVAVIDEEKLINVYAWLGTSEWASLQSVEDVKFVAPVDDEEMIQEMSQKSWGDNVIYGRAESSRRSTV